MELLEELCCQDAKWVRFTAENLPIYCRGKVVKLSNFFNVSNFHVYLYRKGNHCEL